MAAQMLGIGILCGIFVGSGMAGWSGFDSRSRFLRRHCTEEVMQVLSFGGGMDPLPTMRRAVCFNERQFGPGMLLNLLFGNDLPRGQTVCT